MHTLAHASPYVPALTWPLCLAFSGATACGPCWCNLFMGGWPWGGSSNSLGRKFQGPEWVVWEMACGFWVGTSPSPYWLLSHGEDTEEDQMGALWQPTFPKRQWPRGWRDALGRRWQGSCKQRNRAEFIFLLLQALGQPHTYSGPSGWRWHLKMGEKRIAFQKKIGLQREYFENKCLEIFLFRDCCWYFYFAQHYVNYLYKCSKLSAT